MDFAHSRRRVVVKYTDNFFSRLIAAEFSARCHITQLLLLLSNSFARPTRASVSACTYVHLLSQFTSNHHTPPGPAPLEPDTLRLSRRFSLLQCSAGRRVPLLIGLVVLLALLRSATRAGRLNQQQTSEPRTKKWTGMDGWMNE